MIRGQPVAGSSEVPPIAVQESHRERVVVRRRRARTRHRTGQWTARTSRRRVIRAGVVCAGVLLAMALGLYFGLSRQNTAPAESRLHGPLLAVSNARG
jgi:hypothetical protein